MDNLETIDEIDKQVSKLKTLASLIAKNPQADNGLVWIIEDIADTIEKQINSCERRKQ